MMYKNCEKPSVDFFEALFIFMVFDIQKKPQGTPSQLCDSWNIGFSHLFHVT